MAINVASDIIFDVLKAANPIRMKLASTKLSTTQTAVTSFDQEFSKVQHKRGIASKLSSDIVMDVIAAADPARSTAAMSKLAGVPDGSFAGRVDLAGLREKLNGLPGTVQPVSLTADNGRKLAYRDFEASVLKSFFETMLPSSAGGFYGQGTAGNVWRSMSADTLAQEFAKAGGIGIAQQLDGGKDKDSTAVGTIAPATQWPYFNQPSIASTEL
jgi:peptidoglycan hydrolase FlgJ